MTPASNISLIGFMGTGKSTIGRCLAQRLGWGFLDTDQLVEHAAGVDIPTLFARDGETAFRDHEAWAIQQACGRHDNVIATGGGAVLRSANREALRQCGLVVLLTARPEVIVERVAQRPSQRPLLSAEDPPLARVLALLSERASVYQSVAHIVVDTSERKPIAVVNEILRYHARWSP